MPHHCGLTFKEGLTQCAPFNGSLGHNAVFARQGFPEFQRFNDRWIIEICCKAITRHDLFAVLDRERLEHPIRISS